MKRQILALSAAALLAPSSAGAATVYSQDFDAPLGAEWDIPGDGRWGVRNYGTDAGNLRPGPDSVTVQNPTWPDYGLGGVTTDNAPSLPRPSALQASSYPAVDARFGGGALTNAAGGPGGSPVSTTLTLTGLAPHTQLDLSFVMGLADSFDGNDGGLVITIDGADVFFLNLGNNPRAFSSWGSNESTGTVQLANNLNLSGRYLEGGSSGNEVGWTTDSAFDLDGTASLSIPHTASTASIMFTHALDSNFEDEGIIIDSLRVATTPIPEASVPVVLLMASLLGLRRRRR